ncbi:MAG TPA: hypothetical protein VF932_14655, partial [Anaerolineae bacterium]
MLPPNPARLMSLDRMRTWIVIAALSGLLWLSTANGVVAQGPAPTPSPGTAIGQPLTLSGWFTVLWGDGNRGSNVSRTSYLLVNSNGTSTPLTFGPGFQPQGGL